MLFFCLGVIAICISLYGFGFLSGPVLYSVWFDHGHYARPRERELEEQMQPLLPLVQLGEVTKKESKQYNRVDPKKPLFIAIKGQIYDVSQNRHICLI